MNAVNKLQLVDGNKLNAILEMIKKDTETKKILESIKNPDNFTTEEKKTDMEKINDRQPENIVEFLKKKNAIKRKFDEKEKEKDEETTTAKKQKYCD